MKKSKIFVLFLSLTLIIGCCGCEAKIDVEDKKDLVSNHVRDNLVVDPTISYTFFTLDMVGHEINSDETILNVEKIQNWLDLNSCIEIVGIIGPIEQDKQTGCYIVYRNSDIRFDYMVYLSKGSFSADRYNAACLITGQNNDNYFLIICHTNEYSEIKNVLNLPEKSEDSEDFEESDNFDESEELENNKMDEIQDILDNNDEFVEDISEETNVGSE